MKKPTPLIDARIYPGKRRRGRYARLLVFVTEREMYEYLRVRGVIVNRYTSAMCLDLTAETTTDKRCFAEIVFSAGFHGKANEFVAHECLHAVLRLCSDSQRAKALSGIDDEERFLAYPLGRMVSHVLTAIYAVEDGIAFRQPRGNALKAMRRLVAQVENA